MRKEITDVKGLAEILGVKKETIYQWTYARKIPHYKMNGIVRFDLDKVERWMNQREVKSV